MDRQAEYRLGHLLVVSQTALTVMLLVAAGLLMKSFIRLQQVDTGLNPSHALTANLLLSKRYTDPDLMEPRCTRTPPFLGGGARETFQVEGHADPSPRNGHPAGFNVVAIWRLTPPLVPPRNGHPAGFNVVSGSFFRTMGMPITRGREFDEQDSARSAPVAVVNETMARRFWPSGDATGKRIRLYYDKDPQRWLTIIGVARDVRYRGRLVEPIPQVFVPYEQKPLSVPAMCTTAVRLACRADDR